MVILNKKGVWRIIEAVIAVLILAGAMLLIAEKQIENTTTSVHNKLRPFLDEVAKNPQLRERILEDDQSQNQIEIDLTSLLEQKIPNIEFFYNVSICDINDQICKNKFSYPDNKDLHEIYSETRLITANIEFFRPKVVRAYIWKE